MNALLDPTAWLWLVLLFLALFLLLKGPRKAGLLLLLLCAGWWLMEVTSTPARLLAALERPYRGTDQPPKADAIIVLGGGAGLSSNDFTGLDFSMAADRILMGIELARRGQGKVLVLGGSTSVEPGSASEPSLLQQWIQTWAVSNLPMLDLGPCRNTRDEAVRAAELAEEQGWSQILLVTSAWHMKRSEATFRAVNLDVIPVGCDFTGTAALQRARTHWIPQSQSLVQLDIWLHEIAGLWYYRLRRWI
jgi:uncharacterized SAM-binding protein YcdF (DUF218 family)